MLAIVRLARFVLVFVFLSVTAVASSGHASGVSGAVQGAHDLAQDMAWRNIGPANMGGRIVDIEAAEGDFKRVFVGTATGGVWKSVNAGNSWVPIFDDYDPEKLVQTTQNCGEILSQDNGLQQVLKLIRSVLPETLRETGYAVALEVAAADLDVRPEETRFLELLSDTLELDRLTTTAIERGIRARNKVL